MSTLLNKSYLVKVSTKGEGGQNALNSVYVVCTQPLSRVIMFYHTRNYYPREIYFLVETNPV